MPRPCAGARAGPDLLSGALLSWAMLRRCLPIFFLLSALPGLAQAPASPPAFLSQTHGLLRELVEINTTDAHGTTIAARAMAKHFLDAGFPAADVQLLGANPNKLNLVVRLRGSGSKPPMLLLGHLDVVEARRQDWSTDPFLLVEKDGVYYGRGTQDMKDGDAIYVASLLRMKREGFQPDRDIILALTAAEENGTDNGVAYLVAHHRDLVHAAFALNADGGGVDMVEGKPQFLAVDASQKIYADFQLSTTNPGGHSSLPVPDNAIYHLAAALGRIQRYRFPLELNAVTRGYFAARSRRDSPALAQYERAILTVPPDAAALQRLTQDTLFNALLRTTCVATRLNAGDANNALPQNAEAIVNCRILPGHTASEVQAKLRELVADPKVEVRFVAEDGSLHAQAPALIANPPQALSPEVMDPLRKLAKQFWGVSVIPDMETGATDSKYTLAAGIPSYDVCGIALNEDSIRAHGRDEDLPVTSLDRGAEFTYQLLRALAAPAN